MIYLKRENGIYWLTIEDIKIPCNSLLTAFLTIDKYVY